MASSIVNLSSLIDSLSLFSIGMKSSHFSSVCNSGNVTIMYADKIIAIVIIVTFFDTSKLNSFSKNFEIPDGNLFLKLLGEHYLKNIPGLDIFFSSNYGIFKFLPGQIAGNIQGGDGWLCGNF